MEPESIRVGGVTLALHGSHGERMAAVNDALEQYKLEVGPHVSAAAPIDSYVHLRAAVEATLKKNGWRIKNGSGVDEEVRNILTRRISNAMRADKAHDAHRMFASSLRTMFDGKGWLVDKVRRPVGRRKR